jgi:hypothetical protein
MNIDWAPVQKSIEPVWKQIKILFGEHYFITIICGFFAVMMTISFYKFLRSISPALVAFIFLLILSILIMHWTVTRTEPSFMKPFIDWLAPFFPTVVPQPAVPPPKPV